MKALRLILFGVALALFALFAFSNWVPVPIVLPDGARVLVSLPVVVFASFLLGWLPVLLLHLASRASWRRRIAKVERLLDEAMTPRVLPPIAEPVPPPILPPIG